MPLASRLILPALLAASLALSACQSSEEKAEGYFTSARALADKGDNGRAIVELRNVFTYAPDHRDARLLLADLLFAEGDIGGAYGQYTLLIDQHPDTVEGHVRVAEIALTQSDWATFEARTRDAQRLRPDDPEIRALTLAADYRRATETGNETARARLSQEATALRAQLPDNPALRRVEIDRLANGDTPAAALPLLEETLAAQPIDYSLQELKLGLLIEAGEPAAVTAHLRRMIELFPQVESLPATLLQWLLQQDDIDGAEAFLRERAAKPDGPIEHQVALVEFQRSTRGPETAIQTLDALITANAGNDNAAMYRTLRASIRFETGDRTAAVAEVDEVLATASPSDQTRRIMVILARMLDAQDDAAARTRARDLVEQVLSQDASQVEALVLRAGWRIGEDRASDAVVDLRAALAQTPEDPRIFGMLADAYLRDGSKELAADNLAQAVKASGGSPETALRYAGFLTAENRTTLAKTVLHDSWRSNRAHPGLLDSLSNLALSTSDWTLAAEIVATMRSFENADYDAAADQLESAVLIGQDRVEEGLALLEARAAAGPADARWVSLIVQTQIRSGKTEDARRFVDEALTRLPDDRDLRHQSAALDVLLERNAQAIAQYRDLIADDPQDDDAVQRLYSLLVLSGQQAEADAILASGLQANPASPDLRWIKASALQEKGDYPGAIAIYEDLYAEDTTNVVVANNLASLITALDQSPATVDRAYAIARRLRGTSIPAFQDTYGWIAHLKGETLEALPYLEAAAKGLPADGSVLYHLGAAYAALGRSDEARAQLSAALALPGDAAAPWRTAAQTTLDALSAPSSGNKAGGGTAAQP